MTQKPHRRSLATLALGGLTAVAARPAPAEGVAKAAAGDGERPHIFAPTASSMPLRTMADVVAQRDAVLARLRGDKLKEPTVIGNDAHQAWLSWQSGDFWRLLSVQFSDHPLPGCGVYLIIDTDEANHIYRPFNDSAENIVATLNGLMTCGCVGQFDLEWRQASREDRAAALSQLVEEATRRGWPAPADIDAPLYVWYRNGSEGSRPDIFVLCTGNFNLVTMEAFVTLESGAKKRFSAYSPSDLLDALEHCKHLVTERVA